MLVLPLDTSVGSIEPDERPEEPELVPGDPSEAPDEVEDEAGVETTILDWLRVSVTVWNGSALEPLLDRLELEEPETKVPATDPEVNPEESALEALELMDTLGKPSPVGCRLLLPLLLAEPEDPELAPDETSDETDAAEDDAEVDSPEPEALELIETDGKGSPLLPAEPLLDTLVLDDPETKVPATDPEVNPEEVEADPEALELREAVGNAPPVFVPELLLDTPELEDPETKVPATEPEVKPPELVDCAGETEGPCPPELLTVADEPEEPETKVPATLPEEKPADMVVEGPGETDGPPSPVLVSTADEPRLVVALEEPDTNVPATDPEEKPAELAELGTMVGPSPPVLVSCGLVRVRVRDELEEKAKVGKMLPLEKLDAAGPGAPLLFGVPDVTVTVTWPP